MGAEEDHDELSPGDGIKAKSKVKVVKVFNEDNEGVIGRESKEKSVGMNDRDWER